MPFEVSRFPLAPGATVCGALVPLPRRTLFAVSVVAPVPPLATGSVPVTPVVKGKPVALVNVAAEGVPRFGVVSVGEDARTRLPVPVAAVAPVPPFAMGSVPVTSASLRRTVSVLLAPLIVLFVRVTVLVAVKGAEPPIVVPAGSVVVPLAVSVPEILNVPPTASVFPAPTFRPTDVPLPAAANKASMASRSLLSFVPQVSLDAPTSGFVRLRFEVKLSAIVRPPCPCDQR